MLDYLTGRVVHKALYKKYAHKRFFRGEFTLLSAHMYTTNND